MAFGFVVESSFGGRKYPTMTSMMQDVAKTLDFNSPRVQTAIKTELRNFLNEIAGVMEAKHGSAYPGGTSETSLSRRTGRGLASIRESIEVTGSNTSDIKGSIGGLSYLGVHEFGAILRAKNKKYMVIPLDGAMNNDGTLQRPRPRDWDRTFVNRSKAGNLIIFRRQGASIIPLYLLVGAGEPISQIEFAKGASGRGRGPLRLGMGDAINARLDSFTSRLADKLVQEMFKNVVTV